MGIEPSVIIVREARDHRGIQGLEAGAGAGTEWNTLYRRPSLLLVVTYAHLRKRMGRRGLKRRRRRRNKGTEEERGRGRDRLRRKRIDGQR